VDDPQRKPGSTERDAVAARIRRAADDGRISTVDRDIRLGNVASAQTAAELDLIARDLDQLEAALPATTPVGSAPQPIPPPASAQQSVGTAQPAAPAWSGSAPTLTDQLTDQAVTAARSTARSIGVVTAVILVLVLAGVGALAVFASHSSSSTSEGALFDPSPAPAGGDEPADDPSTGPGSGPSADPGTGAAYALSARGIRAFVQLYRQKFGTTQVIDAVLYPDYAVVQAPQAGGKRHAGFLYRRGQGWADFGGISANFPGAQPVDLAALDVRALVRNIARARRSLGVEDPTTTYVIVRQYAPADAVPSVDIHVANAFNESGYLATRLDGTVERAHPYGQ
jgi:hypothetical protein